MADPKKMTPAQQVTTALALAVETWAADLRRASPLDASIRVLTIGRLEGVALGLRAIAALASSDEEPGNG